MKMTSVDMTQALIELSKSQPDPAQFLREVRDALTKEVGKEEGTVHVVITTPTGDAGALRQTVTDMIQKKLNRPVEVTERTDKTLIGGAIVTFGDEQIDMSMRGALTQAADAIAHASLSPQS